MRTTTTSTASGTPRSRSWRTAALITLAVLGIFRLRDDRSSLRRRSLRTEGGGHRRTGGVTDRRQQGVGRRRGPRGVAVHVQRGQGLHPQRDVEPRPGGDDRSVRRGLHRTRTGIPVAVQQHPPEVHAGRVRAQPGRRARQLDHEVLRRTVRSRRAAGPPGVVAPSPGRVRGGKQRARASTTHADRRPPTRGQLRRWIPGNRGIGGHRRNAQGADVLHSGDLH